MAAFEGYLLARIGTGNTVIQFPNQYMLAETWDSTPDQREELKAYRDDNTRELYRITASGRKSTFSFKTRPGLHKSEKEAVQAFFTASMTDVNQRKCYLKFWNDEENQYKTGYFYIPNTKFPIQTILSNDIIYDSVEYSFVEY